MMTRTCSPLFLTHTSKWPSPSFLYFPQLCLCVYGLVQDLNVHLGTLIGKIWSPGSGRAGPLSPKNLQRCLPAPGDGVVFIAGF